MSDLLRAFPIEPELADDPTFRNATGVGMKIFNFVSIDPDAETQGMSRGGRGDREVFDEFGHDQERLAAAAAAIRSNFGAVSAREATEEEPEIEDAEEGALLTRVHRVRERNAKIVQKKKSDVLKQHGRLTCEGCSFDFAERYGSHGEGFMECHHTVPLSQLDKKRPTGLGDLVLVCANCHRMIHRRRPWLTMADLRTLLR